MSPEDVKADMHNVPEAMVEKEKAEDISPKSHQTRGPYASES